MLRFDFLVYLGYCIDAAGGSEANIGRRIELTHTCMKALDRETFVTLT